MVSEAPLEQDELFNTAVDHFNRNEYRPAEAILNQLILKNCKKPDVFHMLGTIYYDQGKFNKAVRSFKRAIEIDPAFTDASIGLSIILNDLGKYEEGQKVFEEAKLMLSQKAGQEDPYINEKIAHKHDELGELYFQYQRYEEALNEYQKVLKLSTRSVETRMRIVGCYEKQNRYELAIDELLKIVAESPEYYAARLKLGKLYYDANKVPDAIEQWENVLRSQPNNRQAKDYLQLAQSLETIDYSQPDL